MKVHVKQAKADFIQAWGGVCNNWNIRPTTGQVHALLLVSVKPLDAPEIMTALNLANGTVNGAVKELAEWGLIYRFGQPKDRAYYYRAEKDVMKIAQAVARMRKRTELDPLHVVLSNTSTLTGPEAEVREFTQMMNDLKSVADMADKIISVFASTGAQALIKLLR